MHIFHYGVWNVIEAKYRANSRADEAMWQEMEIDYNDKNIHY